MRGKNVNAKYNLHSCFVSSVFGYAELPHVYKPRFLGSSAFQAWFSGKPTRESSSMLVFATASALAETIAWSHNYFPWCPSVSLRGPFYMDPGLPERAETKAKALLHRCESSKEG